MYISQYKDIAMSNMKIYGIPAKYYLAQGILESGAGRGDLCIRANNHFGIKCHEGWTGESVDTMMIRVRNVLENTMNLQSHLMIMPCF
jgi:flagellum-specific peptidoglycan hydrolase FlgJ